MIATIGQTLIFLALLAVSGITVAGGIVWSYRKEQQDLNRKFDKKGKR